jgi:hypothetical protein
MSLEYWITRWSLSSAVALRRPGVGDDEQGLLRAGTASPAARRARIFSSESRTARARDKMAPLSQGQMRCKPQYDLVA